MLESVKRQLAPNGVLRAGINLSNFLLVSDQSTTGDPIGVSPDIAEGVATKLGVEIEFITYKGPGDVADAILNDEWDIANIAAEPERAKTIAFSHAYCEIQATYLLPANSPIKSMTDVDQAGNRISVKERAAYDLWLTDNLKHATLVRSVSMDESLHVFTEQSLDVLAGLRPRLIEDQKQLPGSVLLEESFTAIQQCIGCKPEYPEAHAFLQSFVHESVSSGWVAALIQKHNVVDRLSPAALAAQPGI
jgi:polar amino acid transport system substrate-binding protein